MLLQIPALLTDDELQRAHTLLADGPWVDGRGSAGPQAALAKRNQQPAGTSPQAVAMISTVSPLVTIVLAVSILGEPFSLADALGSALVLAGVGYFTWADSRAKAAQTADALE